MGDLYGRAGATSTAIEIPYRAFRLQLARKLGRSSTSTNAELATAATLSLGFPESEIMETLTVAEAGSKGPRVPGKKALDVVQKLVRGLHQLSIPHIAQEKKI
jgi:predicted DNA-binding transcriptional regulator YafY